jgi:hypothetical protein
MLEEEQVHDLHLLNGCDLSVELEGLRACVDRVKGEHATKVGQLT